MCSFRSISTSLLRRRFKCHHAMLHPTKEERCVTTLKTPAPGQLHVHTEGTANSWGMENFQRRAAGYINEPNDYNIEIEVLGKFKSKFS